MSWKFIIAALFLSACNPPLPAESEVASTDVINFRSFMLTVDLPDGTKTQFYEYGSGRLQSKEDGTVELSALGCRLTIAGRYAEAETRPISASRIYSIMAEFRRLKQSDKMGLSFVGSLRQPRPTGIGAINSVRFPCSNDTRYFLDIRDFLGKTGKHMLWLAIYIQQTSTKSDNNISRFALIMSADDFNISRAEHATGMARDLAFDMYRSLPDRE